MKNVDLPQNIKTPFLDVEGAIGVVQEGKISQKNKNLDIENNSEIVDGEDLSLDIDESILDEIEDSLVSLDEKIQDMQLNLADVESNLLTLDEIYKKTEVKHIEFEHESLIALDESKQRLYDSFDDMSNNRYMSYTEPSLIFSDDTIPLETPNDAPIILETPGYVPEDTAPNILEIPEDTPPQVLVAADSHYHLGTEDNPIDNDFISVGYLNSNDSLPDDGEYTYTLKSPPSHGEVIIMRDGSFRFEPDDYYDGPDSFEYEITHIDGRTSSATAHFNINSINTEVVDDMITTKEDESVLIDVLNNDTSNGDKSPVVSVSDGLNGTVTIEEDGTLRYTPNENFYGEDSFEYTNAEGNTATVTVIIDAVNDVTILNADYATTSMDESINIDVLANDIDVDEKSKVIRVTDGSNGTVTINSDGTLTYTPNEGFTGTDRFRYTNEEGASVGVSVDVVGAVSNNLKAVDDRFSMGSESVPVSTDFILSYTLTRNDTLPENGEYLYSANTLPEHGVLTLYGDGSFNFEPEDYYTGQDSFIYEIEDENGNKSVATVELNIVSEERTDSAPIILEEDGISTIGLESVLDSDSKDIDDGFNYEQNRSQGFDFMLSEDINLETIEQNIPSSDAEVLSITLEDVLPSVADDSIIAIEVSEENELTFSITSQLESSENLLDDTQYYVSNNFIEVDLEVQIVIDEY